MPYEEAAMQDWVDETTIETIDAVVNKPNNRLARALKEHRNSKKPLREILAKMNNCSIIQGQLVHNGTGKTHLDDALWQSYGIGALGIQVCFVCGNGIEWTQLLLHLQENFNGVGHREKTNKIISNAINKTFWDWQRKGGGNGGWTYLGSDISYDSPKQ